MNVKLCLASISLLAASLCIFAPSARATVALPNQTFYFSGVCGDCTGTGQGVLVLQNYTAGAALTASNFVSFNYTSNLLPSYSFAGDTITYFNGSIGSATGPYAVTLSGKKTSGGYDELITYVSGSWCLGLSCASDQGSLSSYSTINPVAGTPPTTVTPEPATLSLLGTGIVAVLGIRRRRS